MTVETINEKHVIEFLKQREQLLQDELKKVRATINVIDSSSFVLGAYSSADNVFSLTRSARTRKVERKALKPISEFLEKGKLDEKISYALTKLQTGYKEDILEVLHENQPGQDIVKLQNAVGVRLSYLLKNDMIAGEKNGRRFNYSLY